jgi:hypothetical protein
VMRLNAPGRDFLSALRWINPICPKRPLCEVYCARVAPNSPPLINERAHHFGSLRQMKAQGMRATEIAKAPKIGRASVYRALEG